MDFFYKLLIISLQHRKKMWNQQKEKEKSAVLDPSIPKGHVEMSSQEKSQTLEILQQGTLESVQLNTSSLLTP